MGQRIGKWIEPLRGQIMPFEQRPDAARWPNDGIYYRIVEAFNTRDGRWDLENQNARGCIDPWASVEWEMGKYIEGSGGATHFFLIALDKNGLRIPGKGMWWFKEMSANFEPINRKDAKSDGTENIPLDGNSYVPERGERGAWSGCLFGRSDVFVGAGLPANEHVSWIVVFQETVATAPDPDPDPDPTGDMAELIALQKVANGYLAKIAGHFS
jgi:hypothetical protein